MFVFVARLTHANDARHNLSGPGLSGALDTGSVAVMKGNTSHDWLVRGHLVLSNLLFHLHGTAIQLDLTRNKIGPRLWCAL